MQNETSNGNGVSEYPQAAAEESAAIPPSPETVAEALAREIQSELDEVQCTLRAIKRAQAYEVANAFLCDARSLARAGKVELAQRKFLAAKAVLGGGEDE